MPRDSVDITKTKQVRPTITQPAKYVPIIDMTTVNIDKLSIQQDRTIMVSPNKGYYQGMLAAFLRDPIQDGQSFEVKIADSLMYFFIGVAAANLKTIESAYNGKDSFIIGPYGEFYFDG